MVLFAVVVVVVTWLLAGAMLATKDTLGQLAGLLFLPAIVVPFIMAYIAHHFNGSTGNPFRGLTWGNTSWYFLTWASGLAVAAVALVICIGLSFNRLDPEMSGYIQMMKEQAAQNSGGEMPDEAGGFLKIGGYITALAAPTILPWISAAFGCLVTFPWFGWFYRRAMVFGRPGAIVTLMLLFLVIGFSGGVAENPMYADVPLWQRMLLAGVASMAYTPAMIWIFLKTRSAVIPALAMYSFQNGLTAASPFLSVEIPLLSAPFGLAGSVIALAAGVGLWIMKDPGGNDLAVAAVAHDGTPLTPEQAQELDAPQGVEASQVPPAQPPDGLAPPPPPPGEIEGLPPDDETSGE